MKMMIVQEKTEKKSRISRMAWTIRLASMMSLKMFMVFPTMVAQGGTPFQMSG